MKNPFKAAGEMGSETTLITECCLRAIADDERFCPRCGWEARVLEAQGARPYFNDPYGESVPETTDEAKSREAWESVDAALLIMRGHSELGLKLQTAEQMRQNLEKVSKDVASWPEPKLANAEAIMYPKAKEEKQ